MSSIQRVCSAGWSVVLGTSSRKFMPGRYSDIQLTLTLCFLFRTLAGVGKNCFRGTFVNLLFMYSLMHK